MDSSAATTRRSSKPPGTWKLPRAGGPVGEMSQVRTSPVLADDRREPSGAKKIWNGPPEVPASRILLDEVIGVVEADQAVVASDGQDAPVGAELRKVRVAELERPSNLTGRHVDDVDASRRGVSTSAASFPVGSISKSSVLHPRGRVDLTNLLTRGDVEDRQPCAAPVQNDDRCAVASELEVASRGRTPWGHRPRRRPTPRRPILRDRRRTHRPQPATGRVVVEKAVVAARTRERTDRSTRRDVEELDGRR